MGINKVFYIFDNFYDHSIALKNHKNNVNYTFI